MNAYQITELTAEEIAHVDGGIAPVVVAVAWSFAKGTAAGVGAASAAYYLYDAYKVMTQ